MTRAEMVKRSNALRVKKLSIEREQLLNEVASKELEIEYAKMALDAAEGEQSD